MGDKRYRVGGTRGGHDQFKWSDVAADEHRENYLGHSLLAPVGRWQKGKDLTWWNKKGGGSDEARAQAEMEKARLKQLDDDLINEALGLAPKVSRRQYSELSKADKMQLLERGGEVDQEDSGMERISGLGAGPSRHHEHIPQLTLKERELQRLKREQELKESGLTEASLVEIVDYEKEQRERETVATATAARENGTGGAGLSGRKHLREDKHAKKQAKKAKKQAKKAKKALKREKRRLKNAKEEPERIKQEGGAADDRSRAEAVDHRNHDRPDRAGSREEGHERTGSRRGRDEASSTRDLDERHRGDERKGFNSRDRADGLPTRETRSGMDYGREKYRRGDGNDSREYKGFRADDRGDRSKFLGERGWQSSKRARTGSRSRSPRRDRDGRDGRGGRDIPGRTNNLRDRHEHRQQAYRRTGDSPRRPRHDAHTRDMKRDSSYGDGGKARASVRARRSQSMSSDSSSGSSSSSSSSSSASSRAGRGTSGVHGDRSGQRDGR